MEIHIPENVQNIIRILNQNNYKAYAVGGCVRDSFMGMVPHDWDICTSAEPKEVLEALKSKNIIQNGMKHGTVTVRFQDDFYEITTFRVDGNYTDNRHPESVIFVRELKEDLARRDFTINAMAYHPDEKLQDYFQGREDIQNKIIRCVGDPDSRFHEDALRILRGLRFASRLGFSIEKNTAKSIHQNKSLLKNISAERISAELVQILDGDYAEKVLLDYADVFGEMIPEIQKMIGFEQHTPYHIYDVWEHTVKVITHSPKGKVLKLSALFHDIGKPAAFTMDSTGRGHFKGHPMISKNMADSILKRLKFDNKTIHEVLKLIEWHDFRPPAEAKYVRRLISEIGRESFLSLMALKRADAIGQNPEYLERILDYIQQLTKLFYEQTANYEDYTIQSLCLNGNDLKNMGITDGKEIGKCLKKLLDLYIDGEINNERAELIVAVRKYINKDV